MNNGQILSLHILLVVVISLSNQVVTGLKCHQCQYTEDDKMTNKISEYLKFNSSLSNCENSPGQDTLVDTTNEEEDDTTSTTVLDETTTASSEGSNNNTEESDTTVLNNRGMMAIPMEGEKGDDVPHLYCVYFKGYTKDEKKRVVVRGAFESMDDGLDKKLVTKEFDKYPVKTSYWINFFANIPQDMTGSELYMCKSEGCNGAGSLMHQFNTISYTCLSITCFIFSRLYNIYYYVY